VLGFLALVVGLAAGPGGAPEPKKVKVTVITILAGEHPAHIDAVLVHIAKEVQKKKPEFKYFKFECASCQSLEVNTPGKFCLVDKKEAEVIIKQPADKNNNVVLVVKPPLQGPFEYETVCGKFLPIITRHETKSGHRLIIAICVQPCKGGK